MAVPLKILVVFIFSFIFSLVNCPPIFRDLTHSTNVSVPIAMVDENFVINSLRKRRETTRGKGCPKGKIFYFTGCRTFKELEDDFITVTTKTSPYQITKPKVQKDKHVEETNEDLSVIALVTPNVATKINTDFHETSSLASQQTTVKTKLNINVIPLKAVVKSKTSDVEANPIPTKFTVKASSNLAVTDPKLIVKSSNKESRPVAETEPALVLVINTATPTPSQVQQETHVLESNPHLFVIPKETFMETKTNFSVSQSIIEVQKLKNMSELSNDKEKIPYKEAGRTTFNVEPVSVETKPNPIATQTPSVAESNHIVFQSTTGADEVALSTVDVTSTSAVVDTKSTVTKIKEIMTSANVEETYEITETNDYSLPKTAPLPTGTRFTEVESDSSNKIVKSWRMPGSHLLDILFSDFERLTDICAVVGFGVVLFIYCICVRKSKKCQNKEEAVERKEKQIVTSNQ